ncbi:hypothetical protein LTR53_005921 [Teratosphaeriaceae sp. CCFEE 6253]|nr:hypothetical protein LTR53_005921 [Teratosphaeriaceae sp. CCFEE 6253]
MAMADTTELPDSKSPHLHLVLATPEELLAQQIVNSGEWRGSLSLEAYLRREDYLNTTELIRDNGLTPWMLVYTPPGAETRRVLCGCESIKKKALLAKAGKVEDVVAHGVASVFCPPKYRGKGYAARMMSEVGKRLETWQVVEGNRSAFSVLFSDIGKRFYASHHWQPFPSAHIVLPPTPNAGHSTPGIRVLDSRELGELCAADEQLMRRRLPKLSESGRTAVALVPDTTTLQWHHAREDFVSKELHGRDIHSRGAVVGEQAGARVWCLWTRVWTNPAEHAPDTLHILRLVVEDDGEDAVTVQAIATLFRAAQAEAHASGMAEMQLWNPSDTAIRAARMLDPDVDVVHREEESIASLRWYGKGSWEGVDWVCNEKYGWC